MKKVILFIAQNIGKVDVLHDKITAAYNLWNTIYQALKPLLPSSPSPVAPVAPLASAAEVAPVAADGPPEQPNDTDFMRASGLIE